MAAITVESLWSTWTQTGYFARGLVLLSFINSVVWILCFWDNLKTGRGVDRLTWMLAISVPILGAIAYLAIALPEREAAQASDPSKPDDWRTALR